IEAFRADERDPDKRGDLSGREWPKVAELSLGLLRQLLDEMEPSDQTGADQARYFGVSPARSNQLLQDADVAGRNIVLEVVASPIPLLRELERSVVKQCILPIEKLGIEIFE